MTTSIGLARSVDPLPYMTRLGRAASGEERLEVPRARLADAASTLRESANATLATMVAIDDSGLDGGYRLAYIFRSASGWISLETRIPADDPHYPSLTPHLPAAQWYEREASDLFGLIPDGHPDPRRLVLHEDWPDGIYPLRKSFLSSGHVPRVSGEKPRFHELHGDGIVEIPVGPIHAGIIEPGHFRFAAVGELVLHLETRLFYTHRGIEKLAEGKTLEQGLQLAERICGACALSNAVSYSQAAESIADVAIPPRAAALRTLFLELERLYNHVGDLGNMCAGTGFAVGASHGSILKEEMQRLNERVTGSRFLRGVCTLGGVRRDVDRDDVTDMERTLERVGTEFAHFVGLLLATGSFMERLDGTGILPERAARDLGAVGVAARASGISQDTRRDRPYAAYVGSTIPVAVGTAGDVRARAQVRIDESFASFRLARDLVRSLPDGPVSVGFPLPPPGRTAIGVTESPRGENVHWLGTGQDGRIDRYRVRSASYCNWPVVGLTVPGNMVPDFPLINKSFELCYSCLDR